MEEKKPKPKLRLNFVGFLILAIIIGFVAGILGEFFTKYYLSNLSFFRDLYFTEISDLGQKDIIITEPRKVVIEQDLRLQQIKGELDNSVVDVYQKSVNSEVTNLLNRIYLPEDYLGSAVILTNDGWLLSNVNLTSFTADDLVVSYNKNLYQITKIVKDPLTGIKFLKLDAQNLPVIDLANFTDISKQQQVIVFNSYYDHFDLANIQDFNYKEIDNKYDFVFSSQKLDKFILLNKSFSNEFIAAPLLNYEGDLLGFVIANEKQNLNLAIPIHYLSPVISQVFKDEEITRPYLGINYINIAQVDGLTQEDRKGSLFGALIWPNQDTIAIAKDSPLINILEPGDLILNIENQQITADNDVLDILLQYKAGQELELTYKRDTQEEKVNFILK